MKNIKYNISLNVKNLKDTFSYFDMNEKNTIIKLVTRNNKVLENVNEYKNNIIEIVDHKEKIIYLKNIKFEKLYYFLNKNTIFNIYYYKSNSLDDIKNNNYIVCVHTRMDRIYSIKYNEDKFDEVKTKYYFKKYRNINIEYIVLFILLIIGILIRVFS